MNVEVVSHERLAALGISATAIAGAAQTALAAARVGDPQRRHASFDFNGRAFSVDGNFYATSFDVSLVEGQSRKRLVQLITDLLPGSGRGRPLAPDIQL